MAKYNGNGISSPCQGCSAREMNCWGACPKYAAFRKKLDHQRAERRKYYDELYFLSEVKRHMTNTWRI